MNRWKDKCKCNTCQWERWVNESGGRVWRTQVEVLLWEEALEEIKGQESKCTCEKCQRARKIIGDMSINILRNLADRRKRELAEILKGVKV